MWEALWRGYLWWVCLAAAASVATPTVVAGAAAEVATEGGGQGECEVLDLSEASPDYVLPTSLTVRPSEAGWRLNVTLGRGTEAAVCVLLEGKQKRLRVTVLAESCDGGPVTDYSYLNMHAPLGVWTTLGVDVAAEAVIVSAPGGINTSVVTHGPPLSHNGTQVVLTGARNVEAAVGCRIGCPGYRHASPEKDKKVTVRQWSEETVQYYFRPGNTFVKLEYEVSCTTPLGHTMFPQVADITLDPNLPLHLWHLVHLHHGSGQATVSLDNTLLETKALPEGCTFKSHTIRVKGDGLFSFSCNPFNGDVEGMEDEGTSVESVATTQPRMPEVAVVVNTIGNIVVVLLLITVLGFVIKTHQLQKQTSKTIEELQKEYQELKKDHKKLEKEHQQSETGQSSSTDRLGRLDSDRR